MNFMWIILLLFFLGGSNNNCCDNDNCYNDGCDNSRDGCGCGDCDCQDNSCFRRNARDNEAHFCCEADKSCSCTYEGENEVVREAGPAQISFRRHDS